MAVNFTLDPHSEDFATALVASGRYSSVSEVLRDSLRLLEHYEALRQEEVAALREEIRKGRESGPPIDAEEFFRELESRYSDDKTA